MCIRDRWYDTKNTWDAVHAQAKELDELINEFNEATGLLLHPGVVLQVCLLYTSRGTGDTGRLA